MGHYCVFRGTRASPAVGLDDKVPGDDHCPGKTYGHQCSQNGTKSNRWEVGPAAGRKQHASPKRTGIGVAGKYGEPPAGVGTFGQSG